MQRRVAIIGAGVSGLTCGVASAESGNRVAIFAKNTGQRTTSAVAAALWFPYDAEPLDKVVRWSLDSYRVLRELASHPDSGVSLIELRQFARSGKIQIPQWAGPLGARALTDDQLSGSAFASGFTIRVPLMDTTIYLDYLAERFRNAGGKIHGDVQLEKLEEVDPAFDLVINCAGIGARSLANDLDLEAHRGQVAIISKPHAFDYASVCDDAPLMYAIPRTRDCVLGGTNELSDRLDVDPQTTSRIVAECSRILNIKDPVVLDQRVGLRPFRKSGVRVEAGQLADGRIVIHNYGHGGSGFTLSWGCARDVLSLAGRV